MTTVTQKIRPIKRIKNKVNAATDLTELKEPIIDLADEVRRIKAIIRLDQK